MSIIAEVKCARCDRKYSGVRSRCPYCGARRIGRGKYTEDSDNSKGKMLIGVLILAVLVVAIVVLLVTTPAPVAPVESPSNSVEETTTLPPPLVDDTENTTLPGINTVPPSASPVVEDTPSPSPSPQVVSVTITYNNVKKTDFTAKITEKVPLRVKIEPVGIDAEIIWESSNTSVFAVVPTSTDNTTATVTGVGKGDATLTVTVGDMSATCTVRVR